MPLTRSRLVQWTLVITRSSGPEKYACYNETLLYQGYKNNKIQWKFTILDHKNYLVIMKPCYISALYNESPLYCFKKYTDFVEKHILWV